MSTGRPQGVSGLADVVRLWAGALAAGMPDDGQPPRHWITALDPARRPPQQVVDVLPAVPASSSIPVVSAVKSEMPTTGRSMARLQAPQLVVTGAESSDEAAVAQHVARQRASERFAPLSKEDYGPLAAAVPPWPALAPRSRWWPRLREFAPMLEGGLDVGRLVAMLARGEAPQHLPHLRLRGLHHHLWVVRDQSRPMVPFQNDFDSLERDLHRHPVALRTTVQPFGGAPPTVPAGVDAVLVLSDLGAASPGAEACAGGWRDWALKLVGRGLTVQAWAPVSAAVVGVSLAKALPVVPWHEASRFRPCRGGGGRVSTVVEGREEPGATGLLPWLAPAQGIEPALLRRTRRAAGGVGQPEWEAALWHGGPEVAAGEQVMQIRPSRAGHWRRAFERLTPAEQQVVWELLEQQHGHLPRSTLLTERLVWGAHAQAQACKANATMLADARRWLDRLAGQEHRHRATAGPPLHGEFLRGLLLRNAADAAFGHALEDVVVPLAAAVGLIGYNQGVSDQAWLAARSGDRPVDDVPWRLVWADPSGDGMLRREGRTAGDLGPWPVLVGEGQGEALWRPTDGVLQPLRTEVSAQAGTLFLPDVTGQFAPRRLDVLVRQPWQEALGRDRYGVFCEVVVADQRIRLRYIPPGTFLMGSPKDVDFEEEQPQHPVTLTESVWLADTPCTQAQWQALMGNNPSHFHEGPDTSRRPVEQVNIDDIEQFLKRLQDLLPQGCVAMLPSEARWEYAAQAGTNTAYWWGNEPDDSKANWKQQQDGTTPVDRYPPNPWGLHDMHGNVWEWCADGQRSYESLSVVNPMGDTGGEARVVRGGSWFLRPGGARVASRFERRRDIRFRGLGFRLALRSSSPGRDA